MIKAIIFDFDGVLVESLDIKTNAFAKLFEQEGEGVVKQIVNYHLKNGGVSRHDKFNYIYKKILKRRLNYNGFQELCNKFATLVVNAVVDAPYVKGAKEFLENNVSKYKCFVASATPQKELEEIVKRRNISHYFEKIYGSPIKKSDAVGKILIEEDVKPINAIFIGDAISDYTAARDNSINFIARINKNETIFNEVDCMKIMDLTNLSEIVETL